MKRFPLIVAAAGGIVAASALGAQAMPAAPVSTDMPIVNVVGGCGPGMHPTRWGGCRPFGWGPRRGPVVVVRPGFRRGWEGERWRHRW